MFLKRVHPKNRSKWMSGPFRSSSVGHPPKQRQRLLPLAGLFTGADGGTEADPREMGSIAGPENTQTWEEWENGYPGGFKPVPFRGAFVSKSGLDPTTKRGHPPVNPDSIALPQSPQSPVAPVAQLERKGEIRPHNGFWKGLLWIPLVLLLGPFC